MYKREIERIQGLELSAESAKEALRVLTPEFRARQVASVWPEQLGREAASIAGSLPESLGAVEAKRLADVIDDHARQGMERALLLEQFSLLMHAWRSAIDALDELSKYARFGEGLGSERAWDWLQVCLWSVLKSSEFLLEGGKDPESFTAARR